MRRRRAIHCERRRAARDARIFDTTGMRLADHRGEVHHRITQRPWKFAMNTAEQNPPRNEQHRHATESPLKKPATETAHASADDIARAATDQGADLDTPTPAAPS